MADELSLVSLPPQPDGVPWPTDDWPTAAPPAALAPLLDEVFDDTDRFGTTFAVAVVQGGRLLAERYGGVLEHWDRESEAVEVDTPLLSWSMAKSVLHATVGVLVGDGVLRLDEPAPVPAWQERDDDPRRAITLEHLLTMRDGLEWNEDYVDFETSHAIGMIFGEGQHDMAGYAEQRPAAHAPDTVFNYSSGTSNIVSGIVRRAVGAGEAGRSFILDRVLRPLGMRSADPRLDAAGTFVGSSYLYASARDWARFGTLYLRDGVWEGKRLLPEAWVDHGRRVRSVDPEDGDLYGAHWWIDPWDRERGTFRASGYEGQTVTICPARDAVVVRLGRTAEDIAVPNLPPWRRRVLDALS
jgi:CubicO group peptidase (beta-lactamase class C family)